MSERYSVEDANDLLPYLAPTLVELRDKYPQAKEMKAEMAAKALSNGGAHLSEAEDALLARVDELLRRVERWNLQLRDIDSGLVDFPGSVEGDDVWLCWRLGEPEVAYWHPEGEGFGTRRPLP